MGLNISHGYLTAPSGGTGPFQWPDATTTGVPAGTVLTNYTGPSVITTSGTIVDSKLINVGIEVANCNNVTFRNCKFINNNDWEINCDTATNMTFTDCEFTTGVKSILAQGTFTRLNIHGSNIGITLKDGVSTIRSCYIHDLLPNGIVGPHYDCIFISGGQTNCLVEDCMLITPAQDGTAEVFIATRWQGSNIVNTTVNHCRMLGSPSYAMYAEQTSVATISGTRWTNNEVAIGGYGYFSITGTTVFKSGNVDAFTGVNIDNQG